MRKNENKIILRDFNYTAYKLYKNGRHEKQRTYRCGSNYALPRSIEKLKPRFL